MDHRDVHIDNDYLVALRREMHMHPELRWELPRTAALAPMAGVADRAFRVCGISRLHNDFEDSRSAAYHIHRKLGFQDMGLEQGFRQLILTREDYLRRA